MYSVLTSVRNWIRELLDAWDRFWFTPTQPHTLAMIRICAGAMLFYTHLVWSKDLLAFVGPDSWIDVDTSRLLNAGSYSWSYLWYVESPALLWTLHLFALVVMASLTIGLFSRATSILAFIITVSYCHRLQGSLFGLDQVNAMLAMYLMVGPCGAAYSVDSWRKNRRNAKPANRPKSTRSANVALRLIQLHMCIMYLFAGLSKMRGETWWDGSAFWFAVANLEYQSLDMTWMVHWPILISIVTHATVFWETFYCVLIWHRISRPFCLFAAIIVHGGIAMSMGMITFGLAMLIGNLSFVPAQFVKSSISSFRSRPTAGRAKSRRPASTFSRSRMKRSSLSVGQ